MTQLHINKQNVLYLSYFIIMLFVENMQQYKKYI